MPGKGLKRSTPHKIRHRLGAENHQAIAAALTGTIPPAAQLKPASRMDQGESETCFAHSAVACVSVADNSLAEGSPLCLASCTYADVRAVANPTGNLPPLADTGAELQDAADALRRWGLGPLGSQVSGRSGVSDVPDDSSAPFPEPNVDELEAAGHTLITGEYSIPVNSDAPRTVAASIVAGFPVWLGTLVGSAFQALQAGDVAQPCPDSDTTAGGHALYISGFRTNAAGEYEFRVENSWGTGWCDNGAGWASQAWLLASWDLWPWVKP